MVIGRVSAFQRVLSWVITGLACESSDGVGAPDNRTNRILFGPDQLRFDRFPISLYLNRAGPLYFGTGPSFGL